MFTGLTWYVLCCILFLPITHILLSVFFYDICKYDSKNIHTYGLNWMHWKKTTKTMSDLLYKILHLRQYQTCTIKLYHKIFVHLCLYNRTAPLLSNEAYTMLQTKNLPNEGLRRRKRILCCRQYHLDILTAANILYMIFHKWTPHHLWSIGIVDIIHWCIYWWCPKKHWSIGHDRKNNSIYFLNIYIQ